MRKFIERALQKLPKLTDEQVVGLVHTLAGEYERLESVLASINQGVIVCDENMNLAQCNKAAERFLPFTTHDFIDQNVWSVIADDDVAAFIKDALMNQEAARDREFYLDYPSNRKIININIGPLVQKNAVEGTIITIEDVTEKREREAKLRRAENLASLTTLAAGVAHEIKNPLGSISIHIQLIQKAMDKMKGSTAPAIEKYLNVVNEEIDRLNKIIVDFLFAVRPINVELADADVNALICSLSEFLQYELKAANIDLIKNLGKDLPLVKIDERYFKQALLNLIKNSAAAMPNGGKLTIKTFSDDDFVYIVIADTGTGIPEEYVSKIFEPYFTTKPSGSGLGLTLTYKIVKEHGGDIRVRSTPGEGTVFTITAPVPQREKRLIGYDDEI